MQTSPPTDGSRPAPRENALGFATLGAHIRTLITLEETEAPVLSCYLDVEAGALQALDRRRRVLMTSVARGGRASLDEAFARVGAFLRSELLPTTKGVAAFVRGGSRPFFLPLQLQVPVPVRVSIDATPSIYELVELKDTYHRYVVMIVTEDHTRILEVTFGAITQELWGQRPEEPELVGRRWTRDHYQMHQPDRGGRFVEEQVAVLDRIMSKGGHGHLVLAGSPRLTAMVRDALPKRLAARLIDIVPASARSKTADVVAATLSSFIAHEEQESVSAAALLVQEIQRNGLAAAGTAATLQALECGQVDVLLLAAGYRPPPGWRCQSCGTVDVRPDRLAACCWRCGGQHTSPVSLKDEMARLAEYHGATFELVRHSDELMELGGVGCLLRYAWSWRPDPA